jgi:hypothetical protein
MASGAGLSLPPAPETILVYHTAVMLKRIEDH